MNLSRLVFSAALILVCTHPVFSQIPYPGRIPGQANAYRSGDSLILENNVLRMVFAVRGRQLHPVYFRDKSTGADMDLRGSGWFSLTLADGKTIPDEAFQMTGSPVVQSAAQASATQASARYADQVSGLTVSATLINNETGLTVGWEARLSDNANYVKQRFVFHARDSLAVTKYTMVELPGTSVGPMATTSIGPMGTTSVRPAGTVDGSPLVSGQMFFALEHPTSQKEIDSSGARMYLPRQAALLSSDSLVITTAFGLTPAGQLRRGFLYYIERERAHPYRPYLHYNSWYDLSWVDRKMEEVSCLDRIRTFGDSLVKARHVPLKAFLFDDGWDNDSSLWQISDQFPDGFDRMKDMAEGYGAHLGVWISPWGGYDPEKARRLAYGRLQHPPFETNSNGFSLAGPVYFQRFKEVTTRFMVRDGVSIFKFDGVGAGNGASGAGLSYLKDIDALLLLTQQLKQTDKDLYLSLTVGTWPSPYWLYYGDAIWRAGGDFGFAGQGSKRQQWITYRDGQSFKNIVQRAPLFPLNSVMLHGICIAKLGHPASLEMDDKNIADEIWAFFASGTSLQELYIDPHLLTPTMWDQLAAAAAWSAGNADVLPDVHWIGGDPAGGEVYGYAAWAPRKGTLSLRNPSPRARTFILDIQHVFELPGSAVTAYILRDARHPQDKKEQTVSAGKPVTITLEPYELRVWDALPVGAAGERKAAGR
jgi:hypothetical protein